MPTPMEATTDAPVDATAVVVSLPGSRSGTPVVTLARGNSPRQLLPTWREDVSAWTVLASHAEREDKVKRFYKRQGVAIQRYLDLDAEQKKDQLNRRSGDPIAVDISAAADDAREARNIKWAVRLSLALNIILCFVKVYAFWISGSLVVAASLMDSALDLLSGGILVGVSYLREHADPDKYPTGKHRFEPLGTLIFACCMCLASVKLMETCIAQIIQGDVGLSQDPLLLIGGVIVVKLIAWQLCARLSHASVSVEALADDHRNDCVSNGVGIVSLFFAAHYWAYIDPIAALITSIVIMVLWSRSAYLQVKSLSGEMAPKEVLNALTLLARNHDERVIGVDTVRAVTGGDGFVVEIDLVLPPTMSLKEAHDIGETFQLFLESIKALDIARAYVHLDYEVGHNPKNHQ